MGYKVKSRIWVEWNDEILIGEGRLRLLNAIEKEGSISKAAKSIQLSYKKAWRLIDTVNKNAKEIVVQSSIGGKGGGGAKITPYGKKMMHAFEVMNKNCWKFLDEEIKKFNKI